MTHSIPLHTRKGVVAHAIVDVGDHVWACQYRWHLAGKYAARGQREGDTGKSYRVYLHREIMNCKKAPFDVVVDHINGDPLDCRRENLRVGDHVMNAQNRVSRPGSSSKYKGVSWSKTAKKWKAFSQMDGTYTLIGYFADEDEAGAAMAEFYNANSKYQRQPSRVTASGPGTSGLSDEYSPEAGPGQLRLVTTNEPKPRRF